MSEDKSKDATSIAKKNLKRLKRVALGKEKPPMFLRLLCWIHLAWGLLMFVGFIFVGLFINSSLAGTMKIPVELLALGGKFFVFYAVLHLIAILGVILMWRIKLIGFYLFAGATFIMPFLPIFFTGVFVVDINTLLFSLLSIGLFALNWKLFNKK